MLLHQHNLSTGSSMCLGWNRGQEERGQARQHIEALRVRVREMREGALCYRHEAHRLRKAAALEVCLPEEAAPFPSVILQRTCCIKALFVLGAGSNRLVFFEHAVIA